MAGILLSITACGKKNVSPKPVPPVDTGKTAPKVKNFSILDSKIFGPDGTEFVAKGINVNGPYWPWDRPTIPDVSLITDVWKFNTVRVQCWPEFSIYNSNNTDLDGIVTAFTAKKIVTILEYQNFTNTYPTGADLTRLKTWWLDIATRFKNNPYVWFNLTNEPGSGAPAPSAWLDMHDGLIKTVRNAGANNIIVCDEHGSGQALGDGDDANSGILTYGASLTAKYKNILFSLHTYDQWVYADDRLKNYIDKVKAKKLALIIGEYGTGNDISSAVATSVFKNVIAAGIGRIGWQWTGVDVHKLTTSGGGGGWSVDNTSGAKPGNLSFVGNLAWDDTHTGIDLNGAEIKPPAVLVSNTGFEDGDPVNGNKLDQGWINFGTAYWDSTPANVKNGTFSVKVTAGAAGGLGQVIYLEPGGTYTLTAWGKNGAVPASASNVGIKYQTTFTGADTQVATLNFTKTGFEQQSATFTLPSEIAGVFLFIYKNDPNVDFWIDDIQIAKK